jgi:hypothetical protein
MLAFAPISRPRVASDLPFVMSLTPSDPFGSRSFAVAPLACLEARELPDGLVDRFVDAPLRGPFVTIADPSFDITERLSHVRDVRATELASEALPEDMCDIALLFQEERVFLEEEDYSDPPRPDLSWLIMDSTPSVSSSMSDLVVEDEIVEGDPDIP